jgi:hypothetical protein
MVNDQRFVGVSNFYPTTFEKLVQRLSNTHKSATTTLWFSREL